MKTVGMEVKSFGKSFSWDYLDKITTQGLSLIISVVLARLIAPSEYGVIAMANIFIVVLDTFVNPGFSSALIQKKSPDSVDYSTVFWCNTVVSAVLYVVIFLAAPFIEAFYKIDRLALVIRVLAITLPFAGVNSIIVAYMRKNMLYKRYFFASLLGTVISGAAAIVMAYLGYGVKALVVYSLGNCILDTFFSMLIIRWRPTFEFSKNELKELYSFGGKMLYIKFIDIIYQELSGLIIGKKYGPTDLSNYNKGNVYPKTIMSSISMSVSDVLFPLFSNIQDKKDELAASLKRACKICDFVIYPMAMGLMACGDNFIKVLLTEKWLSCVPYLRIACFYYLCTPSSGIIYQVIKALGKSGLLLKLEFIKKIYSIGLMILSILVFDSPLAITTSIVVSGFISLIINLNIISRCVDYRIRDYLVGIFPTVIITAVMALAVISLNIFNFGVFITLVLQVIVGVIVYVGLAWLFKLEPFFFVYTMLKKK